jgi:GGDEF domain-containing protein/EAL domain-containing protein (putative c-di-GMP-specific phosphodiesterase class I)
LTGLASRAAFDRAMSQVDADRDQAAVIVISVTNVADLNLTCGWDAGDDLLSRLGHTLSQQTSVDITAARLAGNKFGLLRNPADELDVQRWAEPIVGQLQQAIDAWREQQVDFDRSPVAPLLVRAGAARRVGAQAWVRAELALEASGDAGTELLIYDAEHPAIATRQRAIRLGSDLGSAIRHGRLTAVEQSIVALEADIEAGDPWVRLDAELPVDVRAVDRSDPATGTLDQLVAPESELAQALDRWLLATATAHLGHDPTGRVVLPLRGLPADRRAFDVAASTLERLPLPPGMVLFDISQRCLHRLADRNLVNRLADVLADREQALLVSGCTGGWATWRILERLPVAAVKPGADLTAAAAHPESPAARILAALVDNVRASQQTLVAPPATASDRRLRQLGFDRVERAETPLRSR